MTKRLVAVKGFTASSMRALCEVSEGLEVMALTFPMRRLAGRFWLLFVKTAVSGGRGLVLSISSMVGFEFVVMKVPVRLFWVVMARGVF